MLIEIGPRMIGRCQLLYNGCTAKRPNIVKKVLLADKNETVWVCQKCMLKKIKSDHQDYLDGKSKSSHNLKEKSQ